MADVAYIYDPKEQRVYEIDEVDLGQELRGGALPASGEQIQDFKTQRLLNEKYGTPGQTALANVEEAAGTLTFGLSRLAQQAAGANPEGLLERSRRASPVVTAGATVAPILLSGGTSALVQGGVKGVARLSAPSAIFAGEQAIARAIAPVGSSLARRTAGQAVGSAVGGAAVTAGELVNEYAVGEPLTMGEDVVPRLMQGAAFGAAAGGLFELGAGGVTLAAGKAKEASNKVFQKVVEKYPEYAKRLLPDDMAPVVDDLMATRAESARGASWVEDAVKRNRAPVQEQPFVPGQRPDDATFTPSPPPAEARFTPEDMPGKPDFGKPDLEPLPKVPKAYTKEDVPEDLVFAPGQKPAKPAPREITEVEAGEFADSVTEQYARTTEAKDKLFGSAGLNDADEALPSLRAAEREALAKDMAIDRATANEQVTSLFREGEELFKRFEAEPVLYGAGVRKALRETLDSASKGVASTKASVLDMFEALDTLKRGLSRRGLTKYEAAGVGVKDIDAVQAARAFGKKVAGSLEDSTVWNQIAARQAKINAAYTARIQAVNNMKRQKLMKLWDKPGGGKTLVVDPKKMQSFLKNLGTDGNQLDEATFSAFLQADRAFLEEVAESAKHMPGQFERSTVDATLARARENLARAREAADARAAGRGELDDYNRAKTAFDEAETARREALAEQRRQFKAGERDKARAAKAEREEAVAQVERVKAANAERKEAFEAHKQAAKEAHAAQVAATKARNDAAKASAKEAKAAHDHAEKLRKEAARAADSEFKAAERLRRAETNKANAAARKAETAEVRGQVRALQGTDVSPMRDALGFGAGYVHPVLGTAYAVMRLKAFLDSPAKAIRAMTVIETSARQTAASIERLSKAVAGGVRRTSDAARYGATASYAKSSAEDRRRFDKRLKEIRELQANPELLAERLDGLVGGFASDAPETAAVAQQTAVRAITYLNENAPPAPNTGAFGGTWVTPQNEVAAWNRAYDVAMGGGVKLLELASTGSVLPSDVEAVAFIYPDQYARIVESLLAHAALKKPSGQALQAMQTILGAPVVASQEPDVTASFQQVYARSAQGGAARQGQATAPSHKGLSAIDLSSRARTAVSAEGPVGGRNA